MESVPKVARWKIFLTRVINCCRIFSRLTLLFHEEYIGPIYEGVGIALCYHYYSVMLRVSCLYKPQTVRSFCCPNMLSKNVFNYCPLSPVNSITIRMVMYNNI